jgi:murein tripeptide amidase MpaA
MTSSPGAALAPGVTARVLGLSLDGQAIDCLTLGDGPRQVWLYARQHPGESMAEWWMEGALDLLTDVQARSRAPAARPAPFHIVPNMNPDGRSRAICAPTRSAPTSTANGTRPRRSAVPRCCCVRDAMDATGVDFAIDVHGDEAIPYVFMAGFEGIPSWSDAQGALYTRYRETLARRSPDFQIAHGYPTAGPGKANLSMSTNQLANAMALSP